LKLRDIGKEAVMRCLLFSFFFAFGLIVSFSAFDKTTTAAETATSAECAAEIPKLSPAEPPASPKKQETSPDSILESKSASSDDARKTLSCALKSLKTARAVIANNIANAETPGFKKSRVILADNHYRHQTLPGVQDASGQFTPVGVSVGSGNRVAAVQLDLRQGMLESTGRELDVAIEGPGFLQVMNPSDSTTLYTRMGKLSKNTNGQLVVCSAGTGRLLEPPIQIPQDATAVVISSNGQVAVGQPGNNQLQQVGQIQLATFVNPEGLLEIGENLFCETDASGPPRINNPGQSGTGSLRQGCVESSNVDLDEEIREFSRLGRSCRKIESLIDTE
jgi:flagellar basal-body rod protein FlgG